MKEKIHPKYVDAEIRCACGNVIKKGDTISAVVAAYRTSGVKVSVDDVIKANPQVKPNALPEGAEIFIPDPALK